MTFRNRSRASTKDALLLSLGHPVIHIPLTNEQLDAIVDAAIKKCWKYFHDFSYEEYIVFELSQQDVDRGYLVIPEDVDNVIEFIPNGNITNSDPMLYNTTEFQFNRNVFSNGVLLTPFSLADYVLGYERINQWRTLMGVNNFPFSFNRLDRIITPRFKIAVGMKCIAKVYKNVADDSDISRVTNGLLFDNETFKDLCTALAKQNLGMIYSKYEGRTLPSGFQISGQALKEEGAAEVDSIMQRLRDETVDFFFSG